MFLSLQEDFYAVVDWAYKIDPLRCISMHGITEKYLSGQKADAAGFVRLLLGDLEARVSMQFSRVCFIHRLFGLYSWRIPPTNYFKSTFIAVCR